MVVHTGGTTGSPKGVMLTDVDFNSIAQQFGAYEKLFRRGQMCIRDRLRSRD